MVFGMNISFGHYPKQNANKHKYSRQDANNKPLKKNFYQRQ